MRTPRPPTMSARSCVPAAASRADREMPPAARASARFPDVRPAPIAENRPRDTTAPRRGARCERRPDAASSVGVRRRAAGMEGLQGEHAIDHIRPAPHGAIFARAAAAWSADRNGSRSESSAAATDVSRSTPRSAPARSSRPSRGWAGSRASSRPSGVICSCVVDRTEQREQAAGVGDRVWRRRDRARESRSVRRARAVAAAVPPDRFAALRASRPLAGRVATTRPTVASKRPAPFGRRGRRAARRTPARSARVPAAANRWRAKLAFAGPGPSRSPP